MTEYDGRECYWCGRVGPYMASASRQLGNRWITRYFCHTDERSCYNECLGRYFMVKYLGGVR